jgi:hypothetical protein
MDTIACEICGVPTSMLGTKRCDACHEVEARLPAFLAHAKGRAHVRSLLEAHMKKSLVPWCRSCIHTTLWSRGVKDPLEKNCVNCGYATQWRFPLRNGLSNRLVNGDHRERVRMGAGDAPAPRTKQGANMKPSVCQTCKREPEILQETRSFVIYCSTKACDQKIWSDGTLSEAIFDWDVAQKKRGPMTPEDFQLARFLFETACEARTWMATAHGRYDWNLASSMENLAVRAEITLLEQCGRQFDKIGDDDLKSASPAAWTQRPYKKRNV